MKQYPQPYDEPQWHPSELEDYEALRDDDTRRRFLLLIGYDEAHKADVARLFGGLTPREHRKMQLHRNVKKLKDNKINRWIVKNAGVIASVVGAAAAVVGVLLTLLGK